MRQRERALQAAGHAPLPSPLMSGENTIDRERFTELLQICDPAMRRLAYQLLGSQSAMDDALQDAYIKAYRNLESFNGSVAGFKGWMYRIVYNTCLDQLRWAKRRRGDVDIDSHQSIADQTLSIGDQVVDRHQVADALATLPADHVAAVTLIDIEGHSYDDAALILDVPRGTVASRVNRARSALRALLAPPDPFDPNASGEVSR